MTREEFQTERTRIISEMLDNPDEYGIYPTTKCFEQLDALFDSLSLPPAEGAEAILKEGLDDGRYADIVDGINIDVKQPFYQAIIRYAEDVVAAQQQPTAEGAEEILDKYPHSIEYPSFVHENSAIAAMTEFATLHAQRIADKMVEDMRQKLLSMRSTKEAMDKLSKADRLMQYGYHDCINEMLMWTKNREI